MTRRTDTPAPDRRSGVAHRDKLVVGFTLILLWISPVAADAGLSTELLVRYATRSANFEDYNGYVRDVMSGRLAFDDRFMQPDEPPGPAPIACDARRIGITFTLNRPDLKSHEHVRLGWTWSHSEASLSCRECAGEDTVRFRNRQGQLVGGMGLKLLKATRHDGTYRIEVTVDGEPAVATEFLREDCDRPKEVNG